MIYDSDFNEVINPDLTLGYLETAQRIVAHHPATAAVPEAWHYEVMEGTDGLRRKVVDTPAAPAKPAWDETEPVQVYIPYTEEELAARSQPTLESRTAALEDAMMELVTLWMEVQHG